MSENVNVGPVTIVWSEEDQAWVNPLMKWEPAVKTRPVGFRVKGHRVYEGYGEDTLDGAFMRNFMAHQARLITSREKAEELARRIAYRFFPEATGDE